MAYLTQKHLKMELPKNFNKTNKKTIQNRSLEILKEVMKIANKHNIKIYAIFGTLLGQARHRGFIPWDDDIDIAIDYFDKDKFIKILHKELNPKFETLNPNNINNNWPGFGVYRNDYETITSTYFEKNIITKYSIDIFEVGKFKNKNDYKKIKIILGMLYVRNSGGGGLQRIARGILKILPESFYQKIYKKRRNKLLNKDGEWEAILVDNASCSWKKFSKFELAPFEDVELLRPKNYKLFLNKHYGDWKKIPNLKEQNSNIHYFGERKK